MADIPNLIITKPETSGKDMHFFFSHKPQQIDFKWRPIVKNDEDKWQFLESYEYPEVSGYYKYTTEGELTLYAQSPQKWVLKFEKTESGWAAVNANGETAVDAGDLKPEPSLLGAGGLPKGHVNLGDQDEEFNMLF